MHIGIATVCQPLADGRHASRRSHRVLAVLAAMLLSSTAAWADGAGGEVAGARVAAVLAVPAA